MSHLSAWQRWWLGSLPHRWRIRRQVPHFLKACPEPFRGQVLEVGAGAGWTSRRILETFPQVELTAIDSDPALTKTFAHLQGRFGRRLKVQVADVLHLPFDRAVFDIVLAINVLPHIPPSHQVPALQHMLRSLRSGGLIGFSGITPQSEQMLINEQCQVLSAQGGNIWARKSYDLA